MRFLRSRRFWQRVILVAVGLLILCLGGLWAWLCPDDLPLFDRPEAYIQARHGQLRSEPEPVVAPGTHDLRLESDSGLVVDMAVRLPQRGLEAPMPLILMIGGYRTGRNAVRLIEEPEGIVIAAIDYPLPEARGLKGMRAVAAMPQIRGALYDTPAALMLALDYLLALPQVDASRIELVGVSLGAPLVCVTGAMDERVSRVWAVQGGGDFQTVFSHVLKRKIPAAAPRYLAARFITRVIYTLSPELWVDRISPRPFIMITAEADERVPRQSVESLFESAKEPREHIRIPGEHIHPRRSDAIAILFRLVEERIRATGAVAP